MDMHHCYIKVTIAVMKGSSQTTEARVAAENGARVAKPFLIFHSMTWSALCVGLQELGSHVGALVVRHLVPQRPLTIVPVND